LFGVTRRLVETESVKHAHYIINKIEITKIFDKWEKIPHILLMAGERTPQELRSVKAVMSAMRQEIEEVINNG
jgi:hypothetical protein